MPEIAWPARRIQAGTESGGASRDFSVSLDDALHLENGDQVTYEYITVGTTFRTKRWIIHDSDGPADTFSISSNENLAGKQLVEGSFIIEVPAGIIVNYPTRPILKDPGIVSNTSRTNPARLTSYTVGYPRYEGSVELDVGHHEDVPFVEAFIDQLHDPANWFEMPLPEDYHLGETRVSSYISATGAVVAIRTSKASLHGFWGRVGWRTCRVTSDSNITPFTNDEGQQIGYNHTITTVPSGLITGPSTGSSNVFSSATTLRARATNVQAIGDTDFAASWIIDFEESDGGATS